MARRTWIGNAQGVQQIDRITISDARAGDTLRLECNDKYIDAEITEAGVEAATIDGMTDSEAAAAAAYAALSAAIADTTITEFREIDSAEIETDEETDYPVALLLYGPTDGKPLTLSIDTIDGGDISVEITATTEGSSDPIDEVQTITLPAPTGGTWTVTFDGSTTAALAYDISAADLETALEGLASVGSGNVTVTGSGTAASPFVVTFVGSLAGTAQPAMTASGANLSGVATATVETRQDGSASTNEVQRITILSGKPSAEFNWNGVSLGSITHTTTAAAVVTKIETAYGTAGVASVTKTSDESGGTDTTFDVEFIGGLAGQNVAAILVTAGFESNATATTTTQGSGGATLERQLVTVADATGGTFTLTYSGETTAAIAYDAATGTVESAIEALSNVDAVTVTGSAGSWLVEFTTPSGNLAQMTIDGSALTGGSIDIETTTEGSASGVNEVQTIEISGASGGTFTLTFEGQTTGAIDFDTSAADLETSLEALSNIGAGEATVAGDDGGPFTVTFSGALGFSDRTLMTADASSLTSPQSAAITTTQNPTGPNWFDNADNYAENAVPVDGDDLDLAHSSVSIRYGLAQSGILLSSLTIYKSFTGHVGLPRKGDAYREYRPTELAIGASKIVVGTGEGSGSPLIRINTGTDATDIRVVDTGSSSDGALPAFCWRGVNVANALKVFKGSFGVAVHPDETATFATLSIGYRSNPDSDAEVVVGEGVTIQTSIEKEGGTLSLYTSVPTLINRGGDVRLEHKTAGDISTLLKVQGGTLFYCGAGTIAEAHVSDEGAIDFSQDTRTRTLTACNLYAGSTLRDPHGTLARPFVLDLVECNDDEVTMILGTHIRHTIADL